MPVEQVHNSAPFIDFTPKQIGHWKILCTRYELKTEIETGFVFIINKNLFSINLLWESTHFLGRVHGKLIAK